MKTEQTPLLLAIKDAQWFGRGYVWKREDGTSLHIPVNELSVFGPPLPVVRSAVELDVITKLIDIVNVAEYGLVTGTINDLARTLDAFAVTCKSIGAPAELRNPIEKAMWLLLPKETT